MNRRTFIRTAAVGSLAVCGCSKQEPQSEFQVPKIETSVIGDSSSHIVTLSFDDGFKKSFNRVADIYEDFGLHACLNVIASAHLPTYKAVDDWILPELMGNFDDWNRLKQRGHEIMPHSWQHENLAKLPLAEATELIDKCLDYFEKNLGGYEASEAIFNFPFNSSNADLEQHALKRVRAIRSGGDSAVNPIPNSPEQARLSCWCYGRPNNCDGWIEKQIQKFLDDDEGGWLILNLHGLDDEGWAPISTKFLVKLLKKLESIDHVKVQSAGEVLQLRRQQ